jgi:hypothetical protein
MRCDQSTNHQSPTTPQGGGAVSSVNDFENREVAQKVLKYRERKAKNQRRYYQKYVHIYLTQAVLFTHAISHKCVQQEMGRRRSAKCVICYMGYSYLTGVIGIAVSQRNHLGCESVTTILPPLTLLLSFPYLTLSSIQLVLSRRLNASIPHSSMCSRLTYVVLYHSGCRIRWQSQTSRADGFKLTMYKRLCSSLV